MKFLYTLNHAPINAHFSKNSADFVVREVPLYEPSGDGEHAMIHLQKKDLTTWEALQILSEHLGVKMRDFGYAGLKDKEGLTSQFVTFPFKFAPNLESFSHEKIKILSLNRHKNKLKIGHLKGNNFFIRLKKVLPTDALKLREALETLSAQGFANYFGFQRFGKFGDNAEAGLAILRGEKRIKNPKMRDFLISAYQSELFNTWLAKRVEISKFASEFSVSEFAKIYGFDKDLAKSIATQAQFYKLLPGEILGHFPHGAFFTCEDLGAEVERFVRRDITSAGLIAGAQKLRASGVANRFESEIFAEAEGHLAQTNGSYRYAWSYIEDISHSYDEEKAQFGFSFYLPKGSYATVILEEILHREIFENFAPNEE
ncbi:MULTISPECIES: tRNA pseudouridine(13) synthase TruD [unclassified Campylobacter]|uniref:tRNA pseudouridine(13) synthase TruD n=1 Tax=unclassified Campylobacter TaxID=2593542 RepID=UPI0022E9A409|nr:MULTISPECIES: tRNA pseudouridine(13) synthase TruD [unclassified Campylobacter]MDA3053899.1 tRNA pseudouridine(13) synthase TruD [Campylobacter sp. VBCF_07 NA4]MDA3069728.1 tRNA pseudouridine(13) synthase TruD [Campylobacter sp. VBCF_08 NA3]WBR54941.1 tRNA pseudouridine(13) synthase TruD [Campylobacter sp. VBCF_01 NA2]